MKLLACGKFYFMSIWMRFPFINCNDEFRISPEITMCSTIQLQFGWGTGNRRTIARPQERYMGHIFCPISDLVSIDITCSILYIITYDIDVGNNFTTDLSLIHYLYHLNETHISLLGSGSILAVLGPILLTWINFNTSMDVIVSIIKCGMELRINSWTSLAAPLKFLNG